MSKAIEAINFLKEDNLKAIKDQWYPGGKQFMSMLQREGKTIDDLLTLFDPKDDESEWISEWSQPDPKDYKLILYRKRMTFLQNSRKEFREEYDPDVSDVDFMRLLELPHTDPQFALELSLEELSD